MIFDASRSIASPAGPRRIDVFHDDDREWLETDGLGGFAMGTVNGIRTRRYHGLLVAAADPPAGRMMLVNGMDVWVEIESRRVALTSHRYVPGVAHPDGRSRIADFTTEPWPTWSYTLGEAGTIVQEIFVVNGCNTAVVTWRFRPAASGGPQARLFVRPLFSGRDYHALHRENPAFAFEPRGDGSVLTWTPYAGVPPVHVGSKGAYRHDPLWYRQFEYAEERARGLDAIEDLASPGEWSWMLTNDDDHACLVLTTQPDDAEAAATGAVAIRADEARRRAGWATPLNRAADAYVVRRGAGRTIVAGYPWFADWGRDTFISMRGLCLATGRLDAARDILLEWRSAVSDGMIPNRFPDAGVEPEFNAVDASLWFVVAAWETERAAGRRTRVLSAADRDRLRQAVDRILEGYAAGTRFGIHCDDDGLLAAGAEAVQLTWMDAKVGDRVVTPRAGKPVEVNALWLNALRIGGFRTPRWRALHRKACASFAARFWNEDAGALYDVVDVDGVRGAVDASMRPNQILAVGGLPFPAISGDRALRVVETVERHLLTPVGLRTLAPGSAGYAPTYEGGVEARDSAYHQGTVWPWLIGPFVEAWLRVHGDTPAARALARRRFLDPLAEHLGAAGIGHLSEIADAEPPFTPRGCPFQAWSLGELIRLDRVVLAAGADD
jgi:predicted glycogen debranching enzyme